MARLILVTGDDPHALLRAAAAPFCVSGRVTESLPVLALRQGGLRDTVYEMAARSGCEGWLGDPVLVFAELAEKLGGELAPLDALERETLIDRIVRETALTTLGAPSLRATLVSRLDRLFGDLAADEVTAQGLSAAFDVVARDDWARGRNIDVRAIYERYLAAIAALPPIGDTRRSEGRDGLAHAARAIRESPGEVALRMIRPLAGGAASRSVHIYGLADLRRGWRLFLSALHESTVIDELRVYVPLSAQGDDAKTLLTWLDERADVRRTIERTRAISPGLKHLRAQLFTLGGARAEASGDARIVEAPDLTRELEHVAREIKGLLLGAPDDGRPIEPHRIAVIARKARPALSRAADVLSRYGIPVYARLRHTASEVPVIAAFLRLLRMAHEGWGVANLSALSNSPYFDVDLDLRMLEQIARAARPRTFAAWTSGIDAGLEEQFDGELVEAGKRLQRLLALSKAIDTVAKECTSLERERPLEEWIGFSIDALGGMPGRESAGILEIAVRAEHPVDAAAPEALRDAVRLDSRALDKSIDLLQRWRGALGLAPADRRVMNAGAWADLLERKLSEQIVTVRVGAPGGVELLEALAADGRSFEHVFIVDAAAGNFPADPAPDPLWADDEREAMLGAGVPMEPSRIWFEREKTLFRGLVRAAARSLQVSYSYADHKGSTQLAAAYVDAIESCFDRPVLTIGGSHLVPDTGVLYSADEVLRAAGNALNPNRIDGATWTPDIMAAVLGKDRAESVVEQLLHAVRAERTRDERRQLPASDNRADSMHEWNGRIADPALRDDLRDEFAERVWSATQLESYGRCPFSFFGNYVLHARELEDVQAEDASALDRGSIIHDALAATYRQLLERFPNDPLSLANFPAAQAILAQAIHEAVDRHGGSFLALPAMREARERELMVLLESYVRWEMANNAKPRRRPIEMEMSFGMEGDAHPPVQLRHGRRTLSLRGKIDRVDAVVEQGAERYRYVIDHKTGGSALSSIRQLAPAGAVLQLALYLAALEQLMPDTTLWGGSYHIIKDRRATAALERCSVVTTGVAEMKSKTQQTADETIRGAAELALSLVDRILAGEFPARTPGTVSCLSYCSYRDVCREERMASWP
ncbi:MAG TPA: PD-(D/E)XK nuclease family protein [Gemmatimonadaceae bacterium]|nr:PD-(D/E)XK nuclease family protein [Gemmatimonadaceae bacterium]